MTTIPGGFYEDSPGSGTYHDANGNPIPSARVAEILAAKGATAGALPADFPARDILVKAGYTSLDGLRAATDEVLGKIDGIGPATITKIREALA